MTEEAKSPNLFPQLVALCAISFVVGTWLIAAQRYQAIFESMNLEVPWITELLLSGGRFVADRWYVAIPFLAGVAVALTWPLRSVSREKSLHAAVIAVIAAALGLGVIWLAIHLPATKLQQAL